MDYEYFKKRYIDENLTILEIAKESGLTKNQVKGRLRRFGIRKTKLNLGDELYDNRDWLYNQYIVQEKGYSRIAKEQGVAYTTILDRINHFGWKVRGHKDIDKGAPNRGLKRSKDTVEKIRNSRVKKRVTLNCNYCNKTFERPISNQNESGNHYCNNNCFRSYLKENRIEQETLTDSAEYKEWRLLVYKRDGYRCKMPLCFSQSKEIHAHHIYPKRDYPELIFKVHNGITLCRKCHELTYGKEYKYIDALVRCVSNDVIKTE